MANLDWQLGMGELLARHRRSGFTIVELLIVIVVIGILAAISIVAYNGIQQRANLAAVQSESNAVSKKVALFAADSGNYPTSITDCPTPGSSNICLAPSSGTAYSYFAFNPGTSSRFGAAIHSTNPAAFEIAVLGPSQFLYTSSAEIASSNEFVQYADLAPIIDRYGLKKYQISFDIKSASIASANTVNVYLQNGSGARYTFSANVPVTTSYERRTVTVTPAGPNTAFAQSILAFYGTYGTGNRPTIKNVRIELAP